MYSHKLPDGYNFWYLLKNLFFRKHRLENYPSGITNFEPAVAYPARSKSKQLHPLQQIRAYPGTALAQNAGKWRDNWKKFILADVDSCTIIPTGGLTNITVQLSNKTAVPIDYVQVAVATFEESGKPYKSEYVEAFNVAPLCSVAIPVYSSPKGTSLNVYITQVVASAFNLQYSQGEYE